MLSKIIKDRMILEAESPRDVEILNNFRDLVGISEVVCIKDSQNMDVEMLLVRFEKIKSKKGPHAYFGDEL